MSQVNDDSRLFVLEIGTEEMPPQDVVDAGQQVLFFFFHMKHVDPFLIL